MNEIDIQEVAEAAGRAKAYVDAHKPDPKPKPIELARVSKHRAGRMPKMTKEERRKRDRTLRLSEQACKSRTEDEKKLSGLALLNEDELNGR